MKALNRLSQQFVGSVLLIIMILTLSLRNRKGFKPAFGSNLHLSLRLFSQPNENQHFVNVVVELKFQVSNGEIPNTMFRINRELKDS